MSTYQRIARLKYKRKLINFRLPEFLIKRINEEKNQTKTVEKALMEYYDIDYPKNE